MERSRNTTMPALLPPLVAVMCVCGVLAGSMDLIDGGHGWSIALVWISAFPALYVSIRIQANKKQDRDPRRIRMLRSAGLVLGMLSTLAAASCLYEAIMGTVEVWRATLGVLTAVSATVAVWYVARQDAMGRPDSAPG